MSYAVGSRQQLLGHFTWRRVRNFQAAWRPVIFAVALLLVGTTSFLMLSVKSNFAAAPYVGARSGAALNIQLPPPQAELAVVAPESSEAQMVQQYLNSWAASHPEQDWGIYFEDITAGGHAAHQADRQFELASMYKLFLVKQLAETVPSSQWASTNIDEHHTYEHCVIVMLKNSDNYCGEAFGNKLGWSKVSKLLKRDGYRGTDLSTTDYVRGTAYDTALLLKRLHYGTGYDAMAQNTTLNALSLQKYRQGIAAGCQGCNVLNKTGDSNGHRHDAAIIEQNSRTYILSIMSKDARWIDIAELSRGVSQIVEALQNE